MTINIRFGRRRGDFALMIDFHKVRETAEADTEWVEGTPLEEITPGIKRGKRAIVLIHRDWFPRLYFLNIREKWTADQYFELAEKLMKRKGIKEP